ncbi:MAG: hypothetical protein ACMXX7_00240 [Candidatus Woesearchaeota archaeon]
MSQKFNPVEKNLFVSMYGINIVKNTKFSKQFSVANVERVILESGANIDGKLSDLSMSESLNIRDISKKRYVAMLSESTAASGIFPKNKYASFFLSTCGAPDPLKALDLLLKLFDPIKVEVRFFTSSPIKDFEADEDSFWENIDDKNIPFFYSIKSKQKDVKGIYFDLISDKHDLDLLKKDYESSPVEKNLLVSLYDVDLDVLRKIEKVEGINLLESVILPSGLNITGRMAKEFEALGGFDIKGFSYVGQLDNGSAAFHITPEISYVSFFISGGGDSIPFKSLEPLIVLFKPSKAEVRYFGSSPIDKIDTVAYSNSKAFWEELDKHEIPESYSIKDKEKLINELYFDLVKD